jgi:uncharacterized membrane protein YgcG
MGTAGQSAPLRRTGSLLGLLGLELAAVAGLHWLGRFEGLRSGWDEPVRWLLSSPVQDVLGALLRTVGLVMAYWLLASTLLYLLASLTRLPGAVRAVGWATLPLVRRVADHALAVTLATSMVGGGTLGMAGPALAADRARAGPPARKPVAAAPAAFPAAQEDTTTTTAYSPQVAGAPREETTSTSTTTASTSTTTTSTSTTTTSTTTTSTTTPTTTSTSTTAPTTTSTTRAPTTTEPATTTTQRPTTTSTTRPPTTTIPPRYVPSPVGPPSNEPTTTTPTTRTTAPPSSATTTTALPAHAYQFPVAGTSPGPKEAPPSGGAGGASSSGTSGGGKGSSGSGSTGSQQGSGEEAQPNESHKVKRGENLWTIARDELARSAPAGAGEPTNQEVFKYWRQVIKANKKDLWSGGDPNLIFPKEPIILPPVD